MLSQNDINVSRYRVMLVYCGKHLDSFNGNDKLSDHSIEQDSVITMMMTFLMTDEMSSSVQLNNKRPAYDNSIKDVKSDKRFKGYKSNVKNDECKDQSLDDSPKHINIPITKLVDSYLSISDRRIKLSQLILEKNIFEKLLNWIFLLGGNGTLF